MVQPVAQTARRPTRPHILSSCAAAALDLPALGLGPGFVRQAETYSLARLSARPWSELSTVRRALIIARRTDMGDFLERCLSAVAEFMARGSVLKGGWRAVGPAPDQQWSSSLSSASCRQACEFPEPLYVHEYILHLRRRVMEAGAHHCRGPGDGCRVTEEAARGTVGGGQSGVLRPGRDRAGEHMRRPGTRLWQGAPATVVDPETATE
jgi:hypothetical protein